MFALASDIARLSVLPIFAWASYRDIRTRRLPNWIWAPLVLFGALVLAYDIFIHRPLDSSLGRLFLIQTAISALVIGPFGYIAYKFGAFGGADAKALVALAILFPTYPSYELGAFSLPLTETNLGVFSLTILTNTVLIAALYPLSLGLYNGALTNISRMSFLGRPIQTSSIDDRHGKLLETPEGFTRGGLDLDALRMYLRWRNSDLDTLRSATDVYRDPATIHTTHHPTDGRLDAPTNPSSTPEATQYIPDDHEIEPVDDPWGAEQFLEELPSGAYGTTAPQLRAGLEVLCDQDTVWVSPGMPFLVPMSAGLLTALSYGDILSALISGHLPI